MAFHDTPLLDSLEALLVAVKFSEIFSMRKYAKVTKSLLYFTHFSYESLFQKIPLQVM